MRKKHPNIYPFHFPSHNFQYPYIFSGGQFVPYIFFSIQKDPSFPRISNRKIPANLQQPPSAAPVPRSPQCPAVEPWGRMWKGHKSHKAIRGPVWRSSIFVQKKSKQLVASRWKKLLGRKKNISWKKMQTPFFVFFWRKVDLFPRKKKQGANFGDIQVSILRDTFTKMGPKNKFLSRIITTPQN